MEIHSLKAHKLRGIKVISKRPQYQNEGSE
jgi:hypothetical protein